MSDPSGIGKLAKTGRVNPRMTIEELRALPADSPLLDAVLPDWVGEAHFRYLETGRGDPWGGYFALPTATRKRTRRSRAAKPRGRR